jgi:hypothetical protein
MSKLDVRSKITTLEERICVGLKIGRVLPGCENDREYASVLLRKSAQAIETKGDELALEFKEAEVGYATPGAFV